MPRIHHERVPLTEEPRILYTREGAGRLLSVATATVDKLIMEGYLPIRRIGRLIRIHRKDLEALAKVDVPTLWEKKPFPEERPDYERPARTA